MSQTDAKLSDIQFSNPRVSEWDFKRNEKYIPAKSANLPFTYSYEIEATGEFSAIVRLRAILGGAETKESPFILNATISSTFHWDDSLKDPQKYLQVNAVMLLISYLRPMITQFTTYAGYSAFVLPFIDVRK